jgi:hypothetical protein
MNNVRRFFADLIGAYIDGARVVCGLPWLFGAIIAWEFAQHMVEYRIGFFDSREAAKAVSLDGSRMILGWIKMLLVYVGGFFAIRYLVLGRQPATKPAGATMLRYLPYVIYSLLLVAPILYADWLVAPAQVMTLRGIFGIGQLLVEPLLMLWIVSAAAEGQVRTPLQSARTTGWFYLWALALFFIGRLPINLLHRFLGTYPIGKPGPLLWPMLALDAVTVGLIITVIPALYVRIARRISEARPGLPTLTSGGDVHPR